MKFVMGSKPWGAGKVANEAHPKSKHSVNNLSSISPSIENWPKKGVPTALMYWRICKETMSL
jgi:hypothetical protein